MNTAASIKRASLPIPNKLALGTRELLGTTVVGLRARPLRKMERALPTRLDPNTSACALYRYIIAAVPQRANKLANLCLLEVNMLTAWHG